MSRAKPQTRLPQLRLPQSHATRRATRQRPTNILVTPPTRYAKTAATAATSAISRCRLPLLPNNLFGPRHAARLGRGNCCAWHANAASKHLDWGVGLHKLRCAHCVATMLNTAHAKLAHCVPTLHWWWCLRCVRLSRNAHAHVVGTGTTTSRCTNMVGAVLSPSGNKHLKCAYVRVNTLATCTCKLGVTTLVAHAT